MLGNDMREKLIKNEKDVLKLMATMRRLSTRGTKNDLAKRIVEYDDKKVEGDLHTSENW